MNLEEFYAQIGGDYADTLQRLCNENMVKKFVKKYQDDPTCWRAKSREKNDLTRQHPQGASSLRVLSFDRKYDIL